MARGLLFSWTQCTDDIVLIAATEEELQDLINRVSKKYDQMNVDETKTMATNGRHCRIFIDNEAVEKVDKFSYLGSLIQMMLIAQNRYGEDSIKDHVFAHPSRIYGKVTIFL